MSIQPMALRVELGDFIVQPGARGTVWIKHAPCDRRELIVVSADPFPTLELLVRWAVEHVCPPADAVGGDPQGGWTRAPRLDPREDH